MAIGSKNRQRDTKAFTLIEIIVVATIIALMASIAIPAFVQSRQESIVNRTANDFRQFSDKFELFAMKDGDWPEDGYPTTIPAGMESALLGGTWTQDTAVGGQWDYDADAFGIIAGVSIANPTASEEILEAVDSLLDDGDLNTGQLRFTGGSQFCYVIAE